MLEMKLKEKDIETRMHSVKMKDMVRQMRDSTTTNELEATTVYDSMANVKKTKKLEASFQDIRQLR